jgi:hypothetical protein
MNPTPTNPFRDERNPVMNLDRDLKDFATAWFFAFAAASAAVIAWMLI